MNFPCTECTNKCHGLAFMQCPMWCEWAANENIIKEDEYDET